MDEYYVRLSREATSKAIANLETVIDYMAQAGQMEYDIHRIRRVISGLHNRQRVMSFYLQTIKANQSGPAA